MRESITPAGARTTGGRNQNSLPTRLRLIVAFDAQAVKGATDIVAVVGEYVRLRRVGAAGRYVGLCPFHQEKSASFNVSQHHQSYKCFGCGSAGDVFTFVMRVEGTSFREAVNRLAQRCGIAPSYTPRSRVAPQKVKELAEVLGDFQHGLQAAVQRPLGALSELLLNLGIDSAECLRGLHRGAYLVNAAKPDDIAQTWSQVRRDNPDAVDRIVWVGRDDRENAELITSLIVDLIARSQVRVE